MDDSYFLGGGGGGGQEIFSSESQPIPPPQFGETGCFLKVNPLFTPLEDPRYQLTLRGGNKNLNKRKPPPGSEDYFLRISAHSTSPVWRNKLSEA